MRSRDEIDNFYDALALHMSARSYTSITAVSLDSYFNHYRWALKLKLESIMKGIEGK